SSPSLQASGAWFARRRPTLVIVGHVAEPGIEHVADVDFAGGVLAAAAAVLVGLVARKTASDLDPFRTGAGKSERDAIIDFEIVGQHQRAGSVDRVGERDHVVEHLFGCAAETEIVGVDYRLVDRERMHDAKLLEPAHERYVRVDIGVPAADLEDFSS